MTRAALGNFIFGAIAAVVDDGVDFRDVEQERRFDASVARHVGNHDGGFDAHMFQQARGLRQVGVGQARRRIWSSRRRRRADSTWLNSPGGVALPYAVDVVVAGDGGHGADKVYLARVMAPVEIENHRVILIRKSLRPPNQELSEGTNAPSSHSSGCKITGSIPSVLVP